MVYKIPKQTRSIVLDAPAQKMSQAGRCVYYLSLRMEQFDDTVPSDINAETIGEHQRRFVDSHARAIGDYLRTADKWVFGPITLTIDPKFVAFEPYETEGDDVSADELPALGQLRLLEGAVSRLRIIDGQHRRRAIRDFLREEPTSGALATRQLTFRNSQMPVAIYEEADTKVIRQMFADIAKQRGIDAVTTARFDARDPYNRAAELVMKAVEWLEPLVEMDRSRVRADSDKLLSFNQLANLLKTLDVGYGGRVSRVRRVEALQDFEEVVERGTSWFTTLLVSARREYEELSREGIDPDSLLLARAKSLAYNYATLRILAGCCFEWRTRPDAREDAALAAFIRSVDLSPTQTTGMLIDARLLEPNGTILVTRPQTVKPAIRMLVDRALAYNAPSPSGADDGVRGGGRA